MIANNENDLDSLNKIMKNAAINFKKLPKYDGLLCEKQRRKALDHISERNDITGTQASKQNHN